MEQKKTPLQGQTAAVEADEHIALWVPQQTDTKTVSEAVAAPEGAASPFSFCDEVQRLHL